MENFTDKWVGLIGVLNVLELLFIREVHEFNQLFSLKTISRYSRVCFKLSKCPILHYNDKRQCPLLITRLWRKPDLFFSYLIPAASLQTWDSKETPLFSSQEALLIGSACPNLQHINKCSCDTGKTAQKVLFKNTMCTKEQNYELKDNKGTWELLNVY